MPFNCRISISSTMVFIVQQKHYKIERNTMKELEPAILNTNRIR